MCWEHSVADPLCEPSRGAAPVEKVLPIVLGILGVGSRHATG